MHLRALNVRIRLVYTPVEKHISIKVPWDGQSACAKMEMSQGSWNSSLYMGGHLTFFDGWVTHIPCLLFPHGFKRWLLKHSVFQLREHTFHQRVLLKSSQTDLEGQSFLISKLRQWPNINPTPWSPFKVTLSAILRRDISSTMPQRCSPYHQRQSKDSSSKWSSVSSVDSVLPHGPANQILNELAMIFNRSSNMLWIFTKGNRTTSSIYSHLQSLMWMSSVLIRRQLVHHREMDGSFLISTCGCMFLNRMGWSRIGSFPWDPGEGKVTDSCTWTSRPIQAKWASGFPTGILSKGGWWF